VPEWTRRDVLRQSAAVGVGLAMGSFPASGDRLPGIRRRVVLGRTGIEVPDICFGSFALEGDEALVRHALDRGITHFDTAESYMDGAAEDTLGRALAGRRDAVTITSKNWATVEQTAADQMRILEASLRRLRTDYIDLYLNHAVNEVARLDNPGWIEFVAKAKQQGKIRFAGMSGHGGRLTECLDHALREDVVDAILVAYNFSQDPGFKERLKNRAWELGSRFDLIAPQQKLPDLLTRAHSQGVGVMVMKTLKGARRNDMRPYETGGATFSQAAFRWVLSNPDVDSLVVTMKSREMVDEYVAASGAGAPGSDGVALLDRYEALNGSKQCQPGCGACVEACPLDVPISDVLRARMYAADYEEPELGRRTYADLGAGAAPCLDCRDTPCVNVCPEKLRVPELTRRAHDELSRAPSASSGSERGIRPPRR
jgi:predicted aldo/keto reductase-like oxidoreductase